MMRILLASIFFIPYFFSLSVDKEIDNNSSVMSFSDVDSISTDTLVSMERTACFGICPAYEVTIYDNGKVSFFGKDFVKHEGEAEGKISEENILNLMQVIRQSNFMKIPSSPECKSRMTDDSSVLLTINIDDQKNSVYHYHGCKGFEFEQELYDLEETIDSLANTQQWIGKS